MICDLRKLVSTKFGTPIVKGSIKGQDNWTNISQSHTAKKGDIVFVWKLWSDAATTLTINSVSKENLMYTITKHSGIFNIKVGVFVANEGDVFSFNTAGTTSNFGHIGCGLVILPKG